MVNYINRNLFFSALYARAQIFLNRGKPKLALQDVNLALSKKPRGKNKYNLIMLKNHILARAMNNLEEAEKSIDKITPELRKSKYELLYSKALLLKGNIYIQRAEYKDGLEFYHRILSYGKKMNDYWIQGAAENNIAIINYRMGKYKKAVNSYKKALEFFLKSKDHKAIVAAYSNIELLYLDMGKIKESEYYIKKNLTLTKKIGYSYGFGIATSHLAQIYYYKKEYKKALKYFKKYLSLSEELSHKKGVAIANINIGLTYEKLGSYSKAYYHCKIYYEISKKINYRRGIAFGLMNLGKIEIKQNKLKSAIEKLNTSITMFENMNDFKDLIDAHRILYELFMSKQNKNKAKKHLEKMLEYAKELNDTETIQEVNENLKKLKG